MKKLAVACCVAPFLLWLTGCASTVRIVVAGDGRATPQPRPVDVNGINDVINRELVRAVLREKAAALLWTGDLVEVTNRNAATFERELLAWRAIYQPLYDHGIKVLPARGNHEMMVAHGDADAVWDRVFSGPYALPENGPEADKNLSFYDVIGPAIVVGVDQYQIGKEMVDVPWLDKTLRENPRPFVFVYGHEPAFMDGHHTDTLDAHPDARDALWECLIRAGARVYLCGHDHFYDHLFVTRAQGDPGVAMHQFTAGTAGAPFYPAGRYAGKNTYWKLTPVRHIDNTYGYILITLHGRRATVEFKGRVAPDTYKVLDRFSYCVER